MRYFNDTEKEVIDYICNAKPTSDESTIIKLFDKKCDCSMQWHKGILTIYVKDPTSTKEITQLLNIICLFDYLKSEGLIYIFRNMRDSYSLINKEHEHIALNEEWDFITPKTGEILPGINVKVNENNAQIALNPIHLSEDISKKIFDFFNCSFFCSETLRHIKNQDYKDDATIQYERNRCLTWFAIGISFVVGLIATIYNSKMYNQNERHHQESMSQTQKTVIIQDTIIKSYQPYIQSGNNIPPKLINDSLKYSKTKSQ